MTALPVTFALEPRFKEQFAQFLEDGFSPFVAAIRIWPKDTGTAALVANTWPNDPYVVAWRENISDKKAAKAKPSTKEAQIQRIVDRLPGFTDDAYLKAERLIAEMSGNIEKAAPPSVTVNANQQVFERVLVVKDHGDDKAWEAKMRAQQATLIEGNVE